MAEPDHTAASARLKSCRACLLCKPASDFYAHKTNADKLYSRCKTCHKASTTQYARENREVYALASQRYKQNNPEKARATSLKSQRASYAANPEKFRARSAKNRAADPDKANAIVAAARAKRPDYMAQYLASYYENNADRIKAATKERQERLREELKPYNCERAMRRNAVKLKASPAWANIEAIQSIYLQAAQRSLEMGIAHEVDHIVPLQSKKVCGLHVECNLQILTATANKSKSNRHWPDQP